MRMRVIKLVSFRFSLRAGLAISLVKLLFFALSDSKLDFEPHSLGFKLRAPHLKLQTLRYCPITELGLAANFPQPITNN